jgi:hypothetical protein
MTRVTSKRIETKDLQGEGSYIVVKPVSYSTAKKARAFVLNVPGDNQKARSKQAEDEIQFTEKMIFESIVEWNWTGDDDQPLPIPRKTEDLDALTVEEVNFIVQSITGMTGTQAKNSESGS